MASAWARWQTHLRPAPDSPQRKTGRPHELWLMFPFDQAQKQNLVALLLKRERASCYYVARRLEEGAFWWCIPRKKGSLNSVKPNQLRGRDHKTLEWVAEQLVSSWFRSEAVRPSQQFQHTVRLLPWDPCWCLGLSVLSHLNKQQQICP